MPDCRFCKKYWGCPMAHETTSLYFREPCEDYIPPNKLKNILKIKERK
jgi:hypothetical protein